MDVTFRVAAPQDLETVARLMRAYFEYDVITFDEPAVRAGLAGLLARPELGWAFVATRGADVIGYAVATLGFDLEFGGRQATLTDLYLEPAHRRAGLGRGLLDLVEQTARDAGARALELQVETDNAEASAFYRARGFVAHTRVPMSKRL